MTKNISNQKKKNQRCLLSNMGIFLLFSDGIDKKKELYEIRKFNGRYDVNILENANNVYCQ